MCIRRRHVRNVAEPIPTSSYVERHLQHTMTIQRPSASVSANFGLLPESRGRFSSFTTSAALNLALAALFIWIASLHFRHEAALPRYESTALVFSNPPSLPPPLPPIPHLRVTVPPTPSVEVPPKIALPKALPEAPKPETANLNSAPMPAIPAAPAKTVVAPPQPRTGVFASPQAAPEANHQAPPTVQAGGFGNPAGAVVNPNAARPSAVAAVGSFNAAPGTNQGAGATRQAVAQGVGFNSGVANGSPSATGRAAAASAGFTNGAANAAPGANRARVATAGFGTAAASGNAPAAARKPRP